MNDAVPTHLSHWGAFRPIVQDGTDRVDGHADITAVRPSTLDAAPSPLLGNLVGSLRHPRRIDRPHVRTGWVERGRGPDRRRGEDAFVPMSWDDVLDVLADELRAVYRTAGPEAVFGGSYGWSSAGRFHHAQSQVHRFLNSLGGYVRSVNTYSVGTSEVLLPHIVGGGLELLGSLTSWPVLAEHTELMVCVGGLPAKNTAVAPGGVSRHRVSEHLRLMADRGVEFVLVGPDRADIPDMLSARWLPVRPGTDTAFLLALAYVLVTERRYDAAFVRTQCAGFDRVVPYLTGKADGIAKNPAWAAALCGIEAAAITELARVMSVRRTMLTVTYALQRAEFGEQPVWAAVLVAALLGQIGLPGGGFGHGYGSIHEAARGLAEREHDRHARAVLDRRGRARRYRATGNRDAGARRHRRVPYRYRAHRDAPVRRSLRRGTGRLRHLRCAGGSPRRGRGLHRRPHDGAVASAPLRRLAATDGKPQRAGLRRVLGGGQRDAARTGTERPLRELPP